jgi:hypothetical protein
MDTEPPSNAEPPSKTNIRVNVQPPKEKEQNYTVQHTRVTGIELFHAKCRHSKPQKESPESSFVLTFRQARANGPRFPRWIGSVCPHTPASKHPERYHISYVEVLFFISYVEHPNAAIHQANLCHPTGAHISKL